MIANATGTASKDITARAALIWMDFMNISFAEPYGISSAVLANRSLLERIA